MSERTVEAGGVDSGALAEAVRQEFSATGPIYETAGFEAALDSLLAYIKQLEQRQFGTSDTEKTNVPNLSSAPGEGSPYASAEQLGWERGDGWAQNAMTYFTALEHMDEFRARVEQLEGERDHYKFHFDQQEQRAEQLERERDNWHASNYAERQARLKAEGERDALRDVLGAIAKANDPVVPGGFHTSHDKRLEWVVRQARAARAEEPGESRKT